ncbi:MAG: tRNA (adenosine(37)-N6)-threonylcarbamoyltransferase complex transferase subunit TsaD [Chloroflexi bacterium]|nr:tRNA (adenosine(37)-N6)-threonylcarbamoyltransferase complex transferase subunit TsaD [Chloroflexota bacterium]MCC6894289.1 tRNA (adenosine(37)-N6)-threonylcarbamoyltransferase complex transferase subunit TsaD [Anaerolineae bacterium]
MTYILGIESSCDETAAAVVLDGRTIVSNIIATQIDLHARYGGVFPELASRAHVEAISAVVDQAITDAGIGCDKLDAIAVTRGPGLVGSLLVGVNYAKGLALATGKPLLGINHLEGHVYSLWLSEPHREIVFPVLVLIVSGGHTELLLMKNHGEYERLGGTLDDAAGEAFDKVGRVLGLPFPGGPNIERAAQMGNATAYNFPRSKRDESYDFSFSGLKTAVMREVTVPQVGPDGKKRGPEKNPKIRSDISVNDVAASFQDALVGVLVEKTVRAAKEHNVTEILLAGGVSANSALRHRLRAESALPVRYPPLNLCTDNGAMIGAAAYYRYEAGLRSDLDMDVKPMWPLTSDAYSE